MQRLAVVIVDLQQRRDDRVVTARLEQGGGFVRVVDRTRDEDAHYNLSHCATRGLRARPASRPAFGAASRGLWPRAAVKCAVAASVPSGARTSPLKVSVSPLTVARPAIGVRHEPSSAAWKARSQMTAISVGLWLSWPVISR